MKTLQSLLPVVAVLSLATPTVGLAKKPDFSKLAGSYRAKYDAVLGPGTTVDGKVEIEISVPENGSKARMDVRGHGRVPSSNLTVALLGGTSFKASRRIASDNALTAFFVKFPARSRLKGDNTRFRYKLTSTVSAGTVSMSYVLRVTRRSISINGTGTYLGDPATVKIRGNRRN